MGKPAPLGYAVVENGAVHHVVVTLEGAAQAALTTSELAKGYKHTGPPSDLVRVMKHNKLATEREAEEWIIRRAIAYLEHDQAVELNGTGYRLVKPFEKIRWRNNEKLERPAPDIHEKLGDPFNPMSGIFSDNIRVELRDAKGDPAYDELRESLKLHGWVPEFPAIKDERGVVLVGNRRVALAKELGIEPVFTTINIGRGDAADARRLRIAIVSNVGPKRLSPNDRKRIAEYLYKDKEWSQDKIAEALQVDQATVSRTLGTLCTPHNAGGLDTLGRKKSPGRPKGKSAAERLKVVADLTQGVDDKVHPLIKEGVPLTQIAKETSMSEQMVRDSRQRLIGQARVEEPPPVEVTETHQCTCPVCGHVHSVGGTG